MQPAAPGHSMVKPNCLRAGNAAPQSFDGPGTLRYLFSFGVVRGEWMLLGLRDRHFDNVAVV